eukprot:GHUV01024761.1.p1 GENE.GHUV01024761.1~~GHUV01024761.1.p1  ORF type:complete len:249 (+),score=46.61 GHUV01024761.1:662-1408(+)
MLCCRGPRRIIPFQPSTGLQIRVRRCQSSHSPQQPLTACRAAALDGGSAAGAAALAALLLNASLVSGAWAGQLDNLQSSIQRVSVVQPSRTHIQPQAEVAGLFDSQSDTDPFTLYGTNFKKYQIERMDGEKVLSRQRGFTVDSCVSAITADSETPEFNGLSTGEKVQAANDLLCKRATGSDLKQACKQSCTDACNDALRAYEERMYAESGLALTPKERDRVLKNCRHSCSYECTKSGKAHDFVVPSRR